MTGDRFAQFLSVVERFRPSASRNFRRGVSVLFASLFASILLLAAGCAGTQTKPIRSDPVDKSQPAIVLLGFADCPNTPILRENLSAALASLNNGWTFTEVDQEQLPSGDLHRGYPTPTILLNDRDLFGLPVPTTTNMACRIYPGGVPDAATVAQKLATSAER